MHTDLSCLVYVSWRVAVRLRIELSCVGGFNPQFFPRLEGIMNLFSRTVTAASLLVHLLVINLFAARSAYLEGRLALWHACGLEILEDHKMLFS